MDGSPLVEQFTKALDKVISDFADQGLSNAEAIGCLELVKFDLVHDMREGSGEDEPGF